MTATTAVAETAPTRDVEVIDPQTGEVIALADAPDVLLAHVLDLHSEHRQSIYEQEQMILAELLARMDRAASWTRRLHDPAGGGWEIKAPSPRAGAEAYDPLVLESEVRALVERGIIDSAAAESALRREVQITVRVPLDAELDDIVDPLTASDAHVQIAGVDVGVTRAAPRRAAHLPSLARLRKVPGTDAALDRARLDDIPPAKRTPTVTRIAPAS